MSERPGFARMFALRPALRVPRFQELGRRSADGDTDGRSCGRPSRQVGRGLVSGPWQARLALAGSETSASEAGYLAGAVEASAHAVAEVTPRFGADFRLRSATFRSRPALSWHRSHKGARLEQYAVRQLSGLGGHSSCAAVKVGSPPLLAVLRATYLPTSDRRRANVLA